MSIVTAQQHPQSQQQNTITVVGLRLSNHWEPPPPYTHYQSNSKLHDRAEIEQNSENESY